MRLRFTIRDLLWLTALVAVLLAWWADHRRLAECALIQTSDWIEMVFPPPKPSKSQPQGFLSRSVQPVNKNGTVDAFGRTMQVDRLTRKEFEREVQRIAPGTKVIIHAEQPPFLHQDSTSATF